MQQRQRGHGVRVQTAPVTGSIQERRRAEGQNLMVGTTAPAWV
jgi:hypothetical protein